MNGNEFSPKPPPGRLPEMATMLPTLMKTLQACLPGMTVTLFVNPPVAAGPDEPMKFNYISNGAKEDVLALCRSFVAKHGTAGK